MDTSQSDRMKFDACSDGMGTSERIKLVMKTVQSQVGEIRQYFSYYISAKTDKYKASARKLAIYGVLGLVAAIAGATLVVMSVVLLCLGIAGAFAALVGSAWIGAIIAGGIFLLATLAVLGIGALMVMGMMKRGTFKKYREKRQMQHEKFGTDVHQRAVEHAAEHG